jgi:hypothetical protein
MWAVASDLEMDFGVAEKALQGLVLAGFADYDASAEVVLVCRRLKYQAPSSPTQIKGALKRVADTPHTPVLFRAFLDAARKYAPGLAGALQERYAVDGETLSRDSNHNTHPSSGSDPGTDPAQAQGHAQKGMPSSASLPA